MRTAALRILSLAALLLTATSESSVGARGPSARTALVVHDRAVGPLSQGRSRELWIACEAVLDPPGAYLCDAHLEDRSWPADEPARGAWGAVQSGPWPDHQRRTQDTLRTDAHGRVRFHVYFEQWPLFMELEQDGPWRLRCEFAAVGTGPPSDSTEEGPSITLVASTRPWTRARFAPFDRDDTPQVSHMFWGYTQPSDPIIWQQGLDLIVATVLSGDSTGTNSNPPPMLMRVEECLYGNMPLDTMTATWSAYPNGIWCPVGEGETIRRWNAARLVPPAAGTRWILAGEWRDGRWRPYADLRWRYADTLRANFVRAAKQWPGRRRAWEWQKSVDDERRARIQRAEADREANRRASASRDTLLRATPWLQAERAIARHADVEELVRSSSLVAIGAWNMFAYESARLDVRETMRPGSDVVATRTVQLRFSDSAPRDSALRRWKARPPLPGWLRAAGGTQCVVFLSRSRKAWWGWPADTLYELAHPVDGVLLATPEVMRRVRAAGAAGLVASRPPSPVRARLAEFIHLEESDARSVAIKLTPTAAFHTNRTLGTLVFDAAPPGSAPASIELFPRGVLAESLYARDQRAIQSIRLGPHEMRGLLDSLAASGITRDGAISAADSVSLTLRQVVRGKEHVFECTLDPERFYALSYLLSRMAAAPAVGPPGQGTMTHEEMLCSNLSTWSISIDPACRAMWIDTLRELRRRRE